MISFTFDKASVIGAMKAHAQAELNLDLTDKVCDVDVSVGRKTPAKPDPDVTVTFKVYDAEDTADKPLKEVADVPAAAVEEQAPVEEAVVEREAETDAPSEEALKEATKDVMAGLDTETKTEEQVDSLFNS